ncbi:hypothetical protein [Maliponia aquimaris]|uniref:SNARE associated Golgi protein n=1 Tax=Maliponia aquimaris TaxID=1673631 RepID=A0A238JZZ3_9RHOB|nr:hypothetical protein [Maliponia aquimaris]SMX36221.1 hypothetical protein MAA8898_00792 [Maliponia aquimaris]
MTPPPHRAGRPWGVAIGLRVAALIVLVLLATWGAHLVRDALDMTLMPENEQGVHRAIMLGVSVYVVLLALPFVPGAEIGIALLTAFGAAIAPLVYGATVLAMLLAYCVGRFLPVTLLARLLALLYLRRAAALIERAAPLPRAERAALLLEGAPPGVVALALRHRYLALALALNIPGNVVIGGGGGIMMLAGISGIFAPLPTLLAVLVAVSPVPLVIALTGM